MVSVTDDISDLFAHGTPSPDAWLDRVLPEAGEEERELLRTAWDVAVETYNGEVRHSGESYLEHSLAVASILAGLKLDSQSIAAGLLHDGPAVCSGKQWSACCARVGDDVAALVDGVGRMDVISELHDDARDEAADDDDTTSRTDALRRMLLAMAQDIRVVFIKLAERLHDLRTLRGHPDAVQQRVARETRDIYAPLAHRLGIWQVKWEMEDLCFRYLEPETYKRVARLLREKRQDRERYIREVTDQLNAALERAGIEADVYGRPKHIYSIWKKMQRKGLGFHELFDIRAMRVMVRDVASCYATLGVVHSLWRHIPKEFDDYITTPKENDYQSLHTAVVGPEGKTLEVQIRTWEMHEQAELGVAAHWRYKEGGQSRDARFEQKLAWLRQLLEWGREDGAGDDFIDRFKAEIFEDRVYVISPKGDVLDLPKGATPLDFAYYIHSDVGHRCRGGKVNGRMVPLTYELRNGDQVEILTSRRGTPSRDWLNASRGYLRTSRARSRVRAWFRQQDHDKNVAAGRQILDRELHRLGVQDMNLEKLADKSRYTGMDDFLAAIGRGDISSGYLAGLVGDHVLPRRDPADGLPQGPAPAGGEHTDEVSIYGVGNLLTRQAGCCKPAPGDPVVGFITRGEGVTIHRRDCKNVRRLMETAPERIIDVSWSRHSEQKYPVDIQVDAYDRQGLLRDITAILTNEKVNVTGVNTATGSQDHQARMTLTVEIGDVTQMSRLMDRIATLRNVRDVRRKT
ncbi:GTP diphosphokinase [Aquisalimonas asiatica]|uniref:GTP pyrophosphokinase n=1 Tax=Aquisalimonas asiatica TaxID=406100 RepID=A0A1H8RXM6_9GAMM|nr:GTP diphosphokinase [Aquisalimonas asiatica]SEO71409.1 (p)ppGpp synthetase I, SpoT/RelA [Aquisalimonas asiatica]